MTPTLDPRALGKTRAREYLVRFAFGGTITAVTGMIAQAWGPEVGGLFLAFPAILPASLTLAAQHDGRRQAAGEARGAVLGAVGLMAFAGVGWWLAPRFGAAVTLAAATGAWVATSVGLWTVMHGRAR